MFHLVIISDIVRDSTFRQLIQWVTGNRVFLYPEEKPGFKCPNPYSSKDEKSASSLDGELLKGTEGELRRNTDNNGETPARNSRDFLEAVERSVADIEKAESLSSDLSDSQEMHRVRSAASNLQRTERLPYTPERYAAEQAMALEGTKSIPIEPVKTTDGDVLLDGYEHITCNLQYSFFGS